MQTTPPFKVGDRVHWEGRLSTVTSVSGNVLELAVMGGDWKCVHVTSVEPFPPHEQLIALAERLGAVEYNSYVDGGLLCRRFITSDGSIDLTVRVK